MFVICRSSSDSINSSRSVWDYWAKWGDIFVPDWPREALHFSWRNIDCCHYIFPSQQWVQSDVLSTYSETLPLRDLHGRMRTCSSSQYVLENLVRGIWYEAAVFLKQDFLQLMCLLMTCSFLPAMFVGVHILCMSDETRSGVRRFCENKDIVRDVWKYEKIQLMQQVSQSYIIYSCECIHGHETEHGHKKVNKTSLERQSWMYQMSHCNQSLDNEYIMRPFQVVN